MIQIRKLDSRLLIAAAVAAVAIPSVAITQVASSPTSVTAGNYTVDPAHTQVVWTLNHMGVTPLSGVFGASAGTLQIDPANPAAAKVSVTFNIADVNTTFGPFKQHLTSPELFDVTRFPTATFVSTSVEPDGANAKIKGNLTIKGITKPVTLDAKFFGSGVNMMNQKKQIGFSAKAIVRRTDFGLGFAVPMVGDQVDLAISGAFEIAG